MTRSSRHLVTLLALVLLVLGTAGVVLAEEEGGEEETLTGCLAEAEGGGYLLVEQDSGDEIALTGSDAVGGHVGHLVEITGQWAEDDEGNEVFEVSSVKHISTSCD